jgi:AcrR family transcriptional regulator
MMMNSQSTKHKILEAAIRMFNQYGVANVRLQQIADETGISVGNLAYHYKNKDAIVSGVYDILFEEFSQILSAFFSSPKLSDLDVQLTRYHAFFTQYRFYFTDLYDINRDYPDIMERWQTYIDKMQMQIRKRLDFNVQRGALVPEPLAGLYVTLTNNILLTIVFWIPQQILKGQPNDLQLFKRNIWMLIRPYFTPQGLIEFDLEIQPEWQR